MATAPYKHDSYGNSQMAGKYGENDKIALFWPTFGNVWLLIVINNDQKWRFWILPPNFRWGSFLFAQGQDNGSGSLKNDPESVRDKTRKICVAA